MHRFATHLLPVFLALAAACAHGTSTDQVDPGRGGSTPVGTGGNGGGGGSAVGTGGQQGSTSTGSGASAPTTCAEANGYAGCCEGDVAYYCAKNSTTVSQHQCPSGQTCGWNASKSYYACVNPPGGADPSHQNPIACK